MNTRSSLNALAFLFTALGTSAQAAVVLPTGDTFLNGTFEFTWASNGAARIDPALYVGGNAAFPSGRDQTFVPPDGIIASTGLAFDYLVGGFGTGTVRITYRVAKHTDTSWHNLRFSGDVSGDTFDAHKEFVAALGAAGGAGEATRFGIADFFTGDLLSSDVLNNGQLDDSDHCQGACEAEGALQWQLDVLGQGETWQIDVLLSDIGASRARHERYRLDRRASYGSLLVCTNISLTLTLRLPPTALTPTTYSRPGSSQPLGTSKREVPAGASALSTSASSSCSTTIL